MKQFIKKIIPILEWPFIPLLIIAAFILKIYREVGSKRLNKSTSLLKKIGVFPIRNHYYEPLFDDRLLNKNQKNLRKLPGIDFRIKQQIQLLNKLFYQKEFSIFLETEHKKSDISSFKIDNGSFKSGDSEVLFNFIRHIKPRRIIEVGCGNSTKIIQGAIRHNENEEKPCSHICIEPFEEKWLEDFPKIRLVRKKVEDLELNFFQSLEANDLLFIDSSHIIKPQGDVLYNYLSIIPSLNKGVYIHVHDIFTPNDYLETWIRDDVRFWNEQYLLEALLTKNNSLKVIMALNFLKHNYFKELKKVCPYLNLHSEPGSFYLMTR